MMRCWINIETGTWGLVDDIRIVEPEDAVALTGLLEDVTEPEIINIGWAFGKPVPESL